jgi:hypothetical protein
MTETIKIIDPAGKPLAKEITDDARWRLPDGVSLGVFYSGRIYPLVNTTQGWVIRLGGQSYAKKPCQVTTSDAAPVTPPPRAPVTPAAPLRPGASVREIEGAWLNTDAEARMTRAAATTQHARVADELAHLRNELADARSARDALAAQVKRLDAEMITLRQHLRDDRRLHKCESTNVDLRGQLTHAQRQVATAQKAAQQATAGQASSEARVTALKTELTQQRQAMTALEQRFKTCLADTAKGARPEAWAWFQALLPVLWPRLQISLESWEVVATHCTLIEPLIRVLSALDGDDPAQSSYSITPKGWREVQAHIATGRDDRLRVYWRPTDSQRVAAVVYYKQDDEGQQAFHRRLERSPPV